jgi:ribosome-associated translation inhibitor RaiA
MNFNIEFKDFTPQRKIQKLIQELITKNEKKTNGFSSDMAFLRLLLEENSARKVYCVSINLELPGKTLVAKEERHNLAETIRHAFTEIDRQLEAYKASLRCEQLWKRRTG